MKTVFVYSDEFSKYDYGGSHPMRPIRLYLTYELIKAYGLLKLPEARFVEARKAREDELLLFHTKEYLEILKKANSGDISEDGTRYGIGYGDNPAFKGVYDWSLYSVGASIQCAELILKGDAHCAFNICGGLHHAMKDRASGFCYLNDAVIAIMRIIKDGKRVAYVDIDAHHGDGVQTAFYDTDKVLTISIHESGYYLFPGTGFADETGSGRGKGYSVNLPLPPNSNDAIFVSAFLEIVPAFMQRFKPDILVTQLGVDTFAKDPITHLNLTIKGFRKMAEAFRSLNIPWVALGGGGYNLSNVARAWTTAWAVMNGVNLPNHLPDDFLDIAKGFGILEDTLEDAPASQEAKDEYLWKGVKKDIEFLKREVLPLISPGS